MDIQPPSHADKAWPFKDDSPFRMNKFKSSIPTKFLSNKLWNCDTLMQYADDCAFVAIHAGGTRIEPPTKLGLTFLPGLPVEPYPRIRGCSVKQLRNRIEGLEMRSFDIRDGPQEPRHNSRTRNKYEHWSVFNDVVDLSEVESRLLDLMFEWKVKARKKFVVLVGFDPQTVIWHMLSRWPLVLNFLDGWVQGIDLAREKIDISRGLPDDPETNSASLLTYVHSLGSNTGWAWKWRENVAVDATFSLMLLLIIWEACREGTKLQIDILPKPPKPVKAHLSRKQRAREKRENKRERKAAAMDSESVQVDYDYGSTFESPF